MALSLREGERERNRKRERETQSRIFAEIMRKFCERGKEKTLMEKSEQKRKPGENGVEGASVGDARRIEFTRESGPWLLVPGFLGLPEARYEFPVLLPGTNSCVSSIYFRVRARAGPSKHLHSRKCIRLGEHRASKNIRRSRITDL